jgi:HPt (histidine-containing phosphotransfer) domain-containing protein
MTELSAKAAERVDAIRTTRIAEQAVAPPLAPLAPGMERILDLDHLARMTGGDEALELEVLRLFAMQCDVVLGRMRGASPAVIGALAHTLNGSARGVGAWAVTEAAETVERLAAAKCDIAGPVQRLLAAVAQTQAAIVQTSRSVA